VGVQEGFQRQVSEILRQASLALGGRTVTLYELSPEPSLVPQVSSDPHPRHHDTKIDLDATLKKWGVPIRLGSRWVGTRLGEEAWVVAPVRNAPPAPPPSGRERRSTERLTLELTGLCIGLIDRREDGPGAPAADPLQGLHLTPGVVAHHVRTPLAAAAAGLHTVVESVGKMADLGADRRVALLGDLADIAESIARASEFLRAVSDHVRGAARARGRFDAVGTVRTCVELERSLVAGSGVTLDLATDLEPTYLQGDPSLLYDLLLHLIRNAVEASTAGRTAVRVTLRQDGEALHLEVRDRGPGIPPHLHGPIFEPGFTTKIERSGTGLAVVRTVAEQEFNGSVRVDSTPGAGATFTVVLPRPPQRGVRTGDPLARAVEPA
jgi:histidine kinase/DNA gyrase B/HSP90-like ATPase